METSLACLRPGVRAVVTHIQTPPRLTRRLAELGLIQGTQVICRSRSPWGDVTAIRFRGTVLALRTRDLERIWARWE